MLGRRHQTTTLNEQETFEMLKILHEGFIKLDDCFTETKTREKYHEIKMELSERIKELCEKRSRRT